MPTLDFAAIKQIRVVDVCGRYKIALKFRGDYANAPCPLPSHKDGDKSKTFSINIPGNYWRCFSDSCNANNGGKRGGDCINFVALMENCREKDAAQKLADWFDVGKTKPVPHMEKRADIKPASQHENNYQDRTTGSDSVKYMASIEIWYDEVSVRRDGEDDATYRKRFVNALKAQMISSFRAGKLAAK